MLILVENTPKVTQHQSWAADLQKSLLLLRQQLTLEAGGKTRKCCRQTPFKSLQSEHLWAVCSFPGAVLQGSWRQSSWGVWFVNLGVLSGYCGAPCIMMCSQPWTSERKIKCYHCLPGFIFEVFCLTGVGGFFFAVVSAGKQPEDVLFPKHKYPLSVRPKPSVLQQLQISLLHPCCDDSSALNDACFQFRVSSLLWV